MAATSQTVASNRKIHTFYHVENVNQDKLDFVVGLSLDSTKNLQATQQDIALTLESPGQKFLSVEENELIQDLDEAMWDPKLQIPEEFRNLEPIWRKLNKASLDQTAMKRENRALMAENSQLQAAMKNYLDRLMYV